MYCRHRQEQLSVINKQEQEAINYLHQFRQRFTLNALQPHLQQLGALQQQQALHGKSN